jgi:hypothetical protein
LRQTGGILGNHQVAPKVRNALKALAAEERQLVDDEDLRGLSADKAEAVAASGCWGLG